MREPKLKELSGVSILTSGFFNRLIRRIEFTKPVAGANITITEQDDGFRVDAASGNSFNVVTYNPITLTSLTANVITINVVTYTVVPISICSNGTPVTVYVLTTSDANSVTMLKSSSTAATSFVFTANAYTATQVTLASMSQSSPTATTAFVLSTPNSNPVTMLQLKLT